MTKYLLFSSLIVSTSLWALHEPCSEIDMNSNEAYMECLLEGDGKFHKSQCRKYWAKEIEGCDLTPYPNKTTDESFTGREDLL